MSDFSCWVTLNLMKCVFFGVSCGFVVLLVERTFSLGMEPPVCSIAPRWSYVVRHAIAPRSVAWSTSRVWGRHAPTRSGSGTPLGDRAGVPGGRQNSRIEFCGHGTNLALNGYAQFGDLCLKKAVVKFNESAQMCHLFFLLGAVVAGCPERSSCPCLCSGVDGKSVSRSDGS